MKGIPLFLNKRKYELLLFALLQHLFIGIVLTNLPKYTLYIWPVNMVLLGVASVGIFAGKGRWKTSLRTGLFVLVLAGPLSLPFVQAKTTFMFFISAAYIVFFVFIFWEVMLFLLRPGYINTDIISAAACGYLLLIEISTFLFQVLFYNNPLSFKGIDASGPAATYIDLVYFSSITLTSIGFGDILPGIHYTKLLTSLLGIAGQFYTVVLVGVLISKFSSKTNAH
ncbi:MAG TPA: potassium channel family protein [Flavisolibacter sp.]|nr:potassium channel family protein [Flavisolibacter sp.]